MLALASAAAFGVNSTIARRGVLRASPNLMSSITIYLGPVYFLLAATVAGEIFHAGRIPWQAYAYFVCAGIVNFALGRTFSFHAVQRIGANRSNPVTGLYTIVSSVLAIVILREAFTPLMALGITLSFAGPLLITFKEQTVPSEVGPGSRPRGIQVDRRTLYTGVAYGICSATFYGASPIFIKMGLESGGSSMLGSLIAYTAATLAICPSLLGRGTREELLHADRTSLKLALMSGLSTCTAQTFRYFALANGTVIAVGMMERTFPVWVLLLSYFFNRKLESFSRWVLLGNTALIVGSILVII